MRLALVTGGSRGLGRALCEQLIARGWRVIEFSRGAPHAYSVPLDLAAPEAARRALKAALPRVEHAPLEELLVISNAGTLSPIGPASKKPPADVLANLNANFSAAILCMSEVVSHFQAAPCRKVIANISSGAAHKPYAGWSLYCAAKAGLEHFMRSMAVEQEAEAAPFTPINILPGVIDTEMQALIRASSQADFPELGRFIQRHDQGELAAPEDVAAAILRIAARPDLRPGERYDVADHRSP